MGWAMALPRSNALAACKHIELYLSLFFTNAYGLSLKKSDIYKNIFGL
jgi:hypothetical protein